MSPKIARTEIGYSLFLLCGCSLQNKINYRVLQNYHIESRGKKMYQFFARILLCVISHRLGADFLWKNCRAGPSLHQSSEAWHATFHVRDPQVPRHPLFPWHLRYTKMECAKASRQTIFFLSKVCFDQMNAIDLGGIQLHSYTEPHKITSLVRGKRQRFRHRGWDFWKALLHPGPVLEPRAGIPHLLHLVHWFVFWLRVSFSQG